VVGPKENGDIGEVSLEVRFSKTTLKARGTEDFHNQIGFWCRKVLVD
jgi:hypothetical protein